jgi:hypothetical protein
MIGMNAEDQLKQEALRIANAITTREVQPLRLKLQELEHTRIQIETDLELATRRQERVHTYRAVIDGKMQCPKCWIRSELHSALEPVGVGTTQTFRCSVCRAELVIDY